MTPGNRVGASRAAAGGGQRVGMATLLAVATLTGAASFVAGTLTGVHDIAGIASATEHARYAFLKAIGLPDARTATLQSDHHRQPLLVASADPAGLAATLSPTPAKAGFHRRLKGPRADAQIARGAAAGSTILKRENTVAHQPSRTARALRAARLPRTWRSPDDPLGLRSALATTATTQTSDGSEPSWRKGAAPGILPAAFTTFGPRVHAGLALTVPPPKDLALRTSTAKDDGARKPFFGGLTEREFRVRETRCMTMAVYHEARGEPKRGQIAVGQIVMNRVRSSFFPDTVCGVIYQGAHRRGSCQFSFACDGISDLPGNKAAWERSRAIAQVIVSGGVWLSDIGHATHYHATYVDPSWRVGMKRIRQIGTHVFYLADFKNWNKTIVSGLPVDRGRAN
ncbi:MAG: cell wall hydrolase [Pseudomonadota bacterium]